MSVKNVLITGGAGFIGSHLADELLDRGYRVRVLDLLAPHVHGEGQRRPNYLHRDVELVIGDIREPAAVDAALEGIDAVYHFAAAVGVGQSMYDVGHYTSVNEHGVSFAGWLPNFRVPDVYAGYRFTVHVPRRPYAAALPGVPTIRVFEALACGMPLVCAPWDDAEGLFRAGHDFLVARDGEEMRRHMTLLASDASARSELARNGRCTILSRHTCAHRVDELTAIASELGVRVRRSPVIEGAVAP